MLHKSGDNLESSTILFIEKNKSITLFSAYLKLAELKIINQSKIINRIIVRWEIKDLCLGVSDIELYNYCFNNNITLFRNTRIHLKAFWNNKRTVMFGSANVTNRGIGEVGNYNYELNGTIKDISFDDILYFNKIINKSELITPSLYAEIKNTVENTDLPTIKYPKISTNKKYIDYFLLSNLPMTESVEELFKGYYNNKNLGIEVINFIIHDLVLYNVPVNLKRKEFDKHLKKEFNNHPFILKLKEHIKNLDTQSLRYGGVVRWIQENTTTVPTPRSWEIKRKIIVNILYSWICYFDDDYSWNIPGSKSEVLYYKK